MGAAHRRRGLALLLAAVLLAAACQGSSRPVPTVPADDGPPADPGPPLFSDQTAAAGVAFIYRGGREANHYSLLEAMGGGVALFDYDGDALLDIFLAGGGYFDGPDQKQIKGHASRLYRNLGGWQFRDVTHESGLDRPLFYTHGCAATDYDRDGWTDLLVTGWGRLALYHNVPDGKGGRRFDEVAEQVGLFDPSWSTSAGWGDLDGDGWPDLYICRYVNWSFDNHPFCSYIRPDKRDVCHPNRFHALPNALFRNDKGRFRDVSAQAGLYQKNARATSKALGVVLADLNDDGRLDIYVANDTTDNLLYFNRGGWKFEETGLASGVARNDHGLPDGSMGVAVADIDGSGRPALWVTNFEHQLHALYRNDGNESFTYHTQAAGIARLGQRDVGFGTAFLDLDGDGWEDLVVSNGHVYHHPADGTEAQRPVLLRNEGRGRFVEVTARGGPYFQGGHVGRGLAAGDLDNDGRTDLVISHIDEPVALLRNEVAAGQHWLGVELAGRDHRSVVGARLVLEVDGRRLTRFVTGGGSYLSEGDPRRLFGLGTAAHVGRLTVTWPSGEPRTQTWDGLAVDRYHRLVQGEAR